MTTALPDEAIQGTGAQRLEGGERDIEEAPTVQVEASDTGGKDSHATWQAYRLFALQVEGPLQASRGAVAARLAWTLALRRGLALRGMPRRRPVFYR